VVAEGTLTIMNNLLMNMHAIPACNIFHRAQLAALAAAVALSD
jgi:hypothetical protein